MHTMSPKSSIPLPGIIAFGHGVVYLERSPPVQLVVAGSKSKVDTVGRQKSP